MRNKVVNIMNTRLLTVLSFIIFHLSFSPVGAQTPWTLDECMDYAIAHNTEMRHLLNEQRQLVVSAQVSKDARLPRINGDMGGYFAALHQSGGGYRFNANQLLMNMGLTAVVPLYTGNRLSSQIKVAEYALQAVGEDVRSAEKNLRAQVAAAYLQVLYNKGEVSIARQRQESSLLMQKQAQSLFEKGKRPESDVVEAAALVSRDQALLTTAEGDVELALLDLRLLLNLPDSLSLDICEPTDSIDAVPLLQSSDTYTQATTYHPAVQSAGYGIKRAEQEVKTARSGYLPTLSLVGELGTFWLNLNTDYNHSKSISQPMPPSSLGSVMKYDYHFDLEADMKRKLFFDGIVGLRLSIPIFNGFETRARIRSAKVKLDDARLAYNDAQQNVQKNIRKAWQGAATAQERYRAEQKSEEACALAYSYAQKRYEAGRATLFDLSQSHQQWFAASENVLRMKYEYLMKLRILRILAEE